MKQKENKIKRKTIRLTETELNIIEKKAQGEFMNFSQFLIASALNRQTPKQTQIFKEIITQIAKIGNNINQIAKICNTEKSINKNIIGNLVVTIAELQTQLNDISKKLHNDL